MWRFIPIVAVALALASASAAEHYNLVAVGSSYTDLADCPECEQLGTVPEAVQELVAGSHTFDYVLSTCGACTWQYHLTDGTRGILQDASSVCTSASEPLGCCLGPGIGPCEWDIVVLQESARQPRDNANAMFTAGATLAGDSGDADVYLYSTWPPSDEESFKPYSDAYCGLASTAASECTGDGVPSSCCAAAGVGCFAARPAGFIPFLWLWDTAGQPSEWRQADGLHHAGPGFYAAAVSWSVEIFGVDAQSLPTATSKIGPSQGLTVSLAQSIQAMVSTVTSCVTGKLGGNG